MDRHAWDERYAGSELLWTAEPNRFLVAEVADLQPGRALDLACGEGRNAVWLAERGWDVTGVDFSSVAIDKARQLAAARGVTVRWEVADLVDYTPPARAYDLVAVLYLHLTTPPRDEIFRRAADAVAPHGTFLVIGHDSTNLTDGHGGPSEPAVLYSADDVAPDPAAFEITKAVRVDRPVATDAGERIALDAVLKAVRR